jgi:voltage-gated potassium channel
VRRAAGVVVTATAALVVVAGIVMRIVDRDEFHNVWIAMWWALQTVTTVGYGDIVPRDLSGRIFGGILMLEGIALLAVITALITSHFVARVMADERTEEHQDLAELNARFDVLEAKLDGVEAALRDRMTG